jgi:hypothetical protein
VGSKSVIISSPSLNPRAPKLHCVLKHVHPRIKVRYIFHVKGNLDFSLLVFFSWYLQTVILSLLCTLWSSSRMSVTACRISSCPLLTGAAVVLIVLMLWHEHGGAGHQAGSAPGKSGGRSRFFSA